MNAACGNGEPQAVLKASPTKGSRKAGFGLYLMASEERTLEMPGLKPCKVKRAIVIGGRPITIDGRAEGLRAIEHTIAHEFGHYEQDRDGRKLTDRGVEVRARNLWKQAKAR